MEFHLFKTAVAKQFAMMQKHKLFRVEVDRDTIWQTYIGAFPEGTNPMFRKRTEYDCACCRAFIRTVGNVVAVINGKVITVWDGPVTEPAFRVVSGAMGELIRSRRLLSPFLHYEGKAGTDKNFEQLTGGEVTQWNHFYATIPREFVLEKSKIPTVLGESLARHDVLLRSLKEITDDAVETVLELIAQGTLYRGSEQKSSVVGFQALKTSFNKLKTDTERDVFAWAESESASPAVSRIRNTAIGTLLVNLSEGMPLEMAVKAWETVMAPANYKRPTALITPAMIKKAKEKLAELGLTSALERRFATIEDISINNVLFADRTARKAITGDVFDDLASHTVAASQKTLDKVEEVSIQKFIDDILPKAESIEVMMDGGQAGNLVSLIAPADPTAGQLFKWPNRFSWSYNGEMADSIKERVKKAGGNVTGDLCCRLAWDNDDDLDFHMKEPDGHEIYYGYRGRLSMCGGMLDVDANGIDGLRPNPVENIFYGSRTKMKEGVYTLFVHNFSQRSRGVGIGFEVEIEWLGDVRRFAYPQVLGQGKRVEVVQMSYSKKDGIKFLDGGLPSTGGAGRVYWGVPSNTFVKVKAMMLSPNFWDDKEIGNKHYFFMLEGCQNDGTARGFFNEFLNSKLDADRKVFEVVGSKMKALESGVQLSGLGFSSTQRNTLLCRVKGSFTRTIKIVF